MDGKSVAWVAYLPFPGTFLVPLLAAPDARLARYHAWQGGATVGILYALLLAVGWLDPALPGVMQGVAAVVVMLGLVAIIWGLVGAARGRFVRVRGVWDLLASLRQ